MFCRKPHISTAPPCFLPPNFTLSKGNLIHIPNHSFKGVGKMPNARPPYLSQPQAHCMSDALLFPSPGSKASWDAPPHPGPLPCAPQAPITEGTTLMKPCTGLSPQVTQSKPPEDRECSYLVQGHIPYLARLGEGSKPTQSGRKSSGGKSGRIPSYLT